MRYLLMLLAVLVVVLLAVFVWPTRYRYDHMSLAPGIDVPVRIDRFSGRAEILHPRTKQWVAQ